MKKITNPFRLLGLILFTLVNSSFSFAAAPEAVENFRITGANVEFFAIGKPSMLKVHGTAKALEGSMSKKTNEISGHFSMKMDDFSTGLGLRDSHLKNKVFEVEKYPTAELTIKPVDVKLGEKTKITGILKFHGVEKEVQCDATDTISGDKATFQSTFMILLTDFNIQPPEFAGMKINNDVRVEVSGEIVK